MGYIASRRGKATDWISFILYLCLIGIGWMVLYATQYSEGSFLSNFSFHSSIGRQTIWLGVSLAAFIVAFSLDWKFWSSFSAILYGISILSLVLLFLFGNEVKGATSWFNLFGFSIQPSEFAKFSTCLALASYLSSPNTKLNNRNQILISIGIFLLPALLIAIQPDAGTAIIFLSFLVMLYVAGLGGMYYTIAFALAANFIGSLLFGPKIMLLLILLVLTAALSLFLRNAKWFIVPILLSALFAFVFYSYGYFTIILLIFSGFLVLVLILNWIEQNIRVLTIGLAVGFISLFLSFGTDWAFNNILKPHQQERINVWLHPEKSNPRGSLYNILQSKTAIGSGGFTGKGFLEGPMTQLNYVPEQDTDFIFSTLGEEHGFLGVFGFILLYSFLIYRITVVAERANNNFIRYYAYGVAGLLFTHFFINIGMTLGIMPVIGIPLIFVSKGGSSLITFSIMLGVLFRMDR